MIGVGGKLRVEDGDATWSGELHVEGGNTSGTGQASYVSRVDMQLGPDRTS